MDEAPHSHTEDADDPLADFRKACEEAAILHAEREKQRQKNEPPPRLIAGQEYVDMINEVKRLTIEYDAIEEPGAYTPERCKVLRNDVKQVGEAIYKLGGVQLMHQTIELYVPNLGGLHGCFDRGFDGVGKGAWQA